MNAVGAFLVTDIVIREEGHQQRLAHAAAGHMRMSGIYQDPKVAAAALSCRPQQLGARQPSGKHLCEKILQNKAYDTSYLFTCVHATCLGACMPAAAKTDVWLRADMLPEITPWPVTRHACQTDRAEGQLKDV